MFLELYNFPLRARSPIPAESQQVEQRAITPVLRRSARAFKPVHNRRALTITDAPFPLGRALLGNQHFQHGPTASPSCVPSSYDLRWSVYSLSDCQTCHSHCYQGYPQAANDENVRSDTRRCHEALKRSQSKWTPDIFAANVRPLLQRSQASRAPL
jgi:hypothetical protein